MLTLQDVAMFWVPTFAAVAVVVVFALVVAGLSVIPTLRAQIAFRLDLRYRAARIGESLLMAFVWALPRRVVYWAIVRGLAHATTGKWGNSEPGRVTGFEMMERWGGEGR